jgi:hypothetical protein
MLCNGSAGRYEVTVTQYAKSPRRGVPQYLKRTVIQDFDRDNKSSEHVQYVVPGAPIVNSYDVIIGCVARADNAHLG